MTKILLVEDDKSLREIYGVRLLAEGYDIVSAGDGEEALAMAIKERPQLIVSDVMMPKISGFDMLDILRSTTETKGIKVIMMTALSSEDQRARGEALGADRYLVKSQVGIEDVVRTVHDVLGDAPMSAASRSPFTSAPSPTPMPRPTTPVPSRPDPTPTPPVAPPSQPPTVAPTPAPVVPQPPAANPLPRPTAPFSTTRPANLGDRIIHPITSQQPQPDVSKMMDDELNENNSATAPQFTPSTPAPAVAPASPTPTPSMTAPSLASPLPTPKTQPSGISFEETPRPTPPPFHPGPQPPAANQ